MEISMRLKDFLAENDGSKLQQLKLACRELGITLKMPSSAYTHDEMVDRVVRAMNAAFKKDGMAGVYRLSSALLNIKSLDVPKNSSWYPLASVQTDAPDTMWSTDLLKPLVQAYSIINAHASEVRDAAKIYQGALDALLTIMKVANGTIGDAEKENATYRVSIAKANLKSLGLRLEAN
jgi:hypothetical protein